MAGATEPAMPVRRGDRRVPGFVRRAARPSLEAEELVRESTGLVRRSLASLSERKHLFPE
jgi:hypothetical protein